MAIVKKYLLSLGLSLVFGSVIAVGFIAPYIMSKAAHAQIATELTFQVEPRLLDAPTYSLMQKVREQLCLNNRDIAAMGCSQGQAEELLAYLADWVVANRSHLESVIRETRQSRQRLQKAYRAINLGQSNVNFNTNLQSLKQGYILKRKEYRDLIDSSISGVEALLGTSAIEIWSTARENPNRSSLLRYIPSLTNEQNQILKTAMISEEIQQTWPVIQSQVLSYAQQQVVSNAASNLQQKGDGVYLAENRVLPMPLELSNTIANEIISGLQTQ